MTDETMELTEQDQADLAKLLAFPEREEAPAYHTILEVWQAVLEPAATEALQKPGAAWCQKIVATHQGVGFSDMYTFRDAYFGKLSELKRIVDFEIASDVNGTSYTTPEEDRDENEYHYKNIILGWNQAFLLWELEWDCCDIDAAIELGAIGEAYKILFGGPQSPGLSAHLSNIQLDFGEDDQADLLQVLEEQREAVNGE